MTNHKLILCALIITTFIINNGIAQVQSAGLNKTFFTASTVQRMQKKVNNVQSPGLDNTFFVTKNNAPLVQRSPIPVPPLTFGSDGVVWAHYEEDIEYTSGNPANTRSEYFLFPINSLIDNNSIYHIYQTGLFQGSYISKRSLTTGNLEWEFSNNLSNNDKVELDFSFNKRSDGNIEVLGFRLLSNQFPNPNPTGIVNRKVYNQNTGELLNQFYTEYEDGGIICLNVGGQFGRTFPKIQDDTYTTSCAFTNREQVIINMSSNQNGLFTDTTEVVSNLLEMDSSPRFRYSEALKLPNGNIAVAFSVFNEFFSLDEIRTEVFIFDQNGVLINRIDVTEIMDFSTYLNMNVVDDKIILSGSSFQGFTDGSVVSADNIAVLDEFGTVYSQINKIDDYIAVNATLLADGQLAAVGRNIADKCLHILYENNGQMESVESICHTNSEDWYVTADLIKQSDDQLLITGRMFRDTLLLDQNSGEVFADGTSVAPVILAFDLSSIDPLSIKNQNSLVESLFEVSPNPVREEINIDFETPQSGRIQLINQIGEIVLDASIENALQHKWPLDHQLSSGMYFVRFENENIFSAGKIIIAN